MAPIGCECGSPREPCHVTTKQRGQGRSERTRANRACACTDGPVWLLTCWGLAIGRRHQGGAQRLDGLRVSGEQQRTCRKAHGAARTHSSTSTACAGPAAQDEHPLREPRSSSAAGSSRSLTSKMARPRLESRHSAAQARWPRQGGLIPEQHNRRAALLSGSEPRGPNTTHPRTLAPLGSRPPACRYKEAPSVPPRHQNQMGYRFASRPRQHHLQLVPGLHPPLRSQSPEQTRR